MNVPRVVRDLIAAALWASVAVYAARVGHNFYQYVDRAIYVTADDGEAGIVYALATQARYAFLASPLLGHTSRLDAQFNYGPWYFYLAAGVVWLFGYSLTAIRSIHLWVVIGCAAAAAAWFRQRDRAAAPALFGLGILYIFETAEWPMARPDSLVTAFAVGMIVSTGLAITHKRPVYWFLAGLTAACGAFTHLIAASLMIASVALFGASAALDLHETSDRPRVMRRLRTSATALVAGLAVGAAMFYASFGFDFARQYRFLSEYRDLTASPDTYFEAITHHFATAFSLFPAWFQLLAGVMLVTAWTLALVVMRRVVDERRIVMAYLIPPSMVWTFYFLSNGKYTNYHSGYAILHHVMFLWTAAAILWVLFSLVARERPRLAIAAGVLASVVVLGLSVRLTAWSLANVPRLDQSESLVPFSEYTSRVLGGIPGRATAWGSVLFGIQSPDRVQLVQYGDAVWLTLQVPIVERQALAPDYLVWGYPESLENTLEVLGDRDVGGPTWSRWAEVLPDARFQLVSLTAGAPYGVTRVYVRTAGPSDRTPSHPSVAVYDAPHHRWLSRVGPALPVTFSPVPPATIEMGPEAALSARTPGATVAASLPAGAYLLHVSITPGAGPAMRRLIAVLSPAMLRQTIKELGARGDFAPYLAGEHDVFSLATHEGGPLHVSQIDDATGARIDGVIAYPIGDLLDSGERPSRSQPLPAFAAWTPARGVRVTENSGRLHVEGDATALGYQVSSPVIPSRAGDRVEIRVPNAVTSGRVCPGVLNADSSRWILTADTWREEMRFRSDASGGFRVVFANCNITPPPVKSEFEVSPGSFVDERDELYAGTLADVALGPKRRTDSLQPSDLAYTAKIVTRPAASWVIEGQAESKYSYLMRAKPRALDAAARVIVSGHVTRGGLTIGLQKQDRWVAQANVEAPGDFRTVLEPPASGSYSVIIANYLGDRLDTSIVIDRVDISSTGLHPSP